MFARQYREDLAAWRERMAEVARETEAAYVRQKWAAEGRMAQQDAMIEAGRGIYGRITGDMVRAGPLRTDEWLPSPNVAGVGRRLGRLHAAELEIE
jgi:hypothetical protein